MRRHVWSYPTASRFHSAMASWIATENNLPHFLERAILFPSVVSRRLVVHNIELAHSLQADAISWASRA